MARTFLLFSELDIRKKVMNIFLYHDSIRNVSDIPNERKRTHEY